MIGIIGGMGPHAGKNLFKCILEETNAKKDQDHLPVILWSTPNRITDRSQFLMGETNINPAIAVAEIAKQMHQIGVRVIGLPCNTFYAKPIWEVLQQKLIGNSGNTLKLINMIDATVNTIVGAYPGKTVGILGTLGTYKYNVYADTLTKEKVKFVTPNTAWQNKVHQSVYDINFGIKCIGKITHDSLDIILNAINQLATQGANLILLGCTELSLVPMELLPKEVLFIDPVEVLAKAMIKAYLN